MTGTNTRLVSKRKIMTENKEKQAKKLIFTDSQSHKSSVKSDLENALHILQNKYDELLNENKNNLEKIGVLEKKIASLEEKPPFFRCDECEYPAEDLCELGEHIYFNHNSDNCEDIYNCNFCEETFESKTELMTHKKNNHEENITICKYFMEDKCAFDAKKCWYSHNKLDEESSRQPLKEYICVLCKETFQVKSEFMKHKKSNHSNNVSLCKNNKNSLTCKFDENCWFIHDNNLTKNISENQQNNEVTEKIFKMLEQFTERIESLEKELKKNKTIHNK